MKNNILITGLPGIGKITIIKQLTESLYHIKPAGFYTQEIKECGIRKGFELVSIDGKRAILSHVDVDTQHRVGKYGVDILSFEDFLNFLDLNNPENGLIVIDEIGKMECLSDKFKNMLVGVMDSNKPVLATIALKGDGFIARIKKRFDVKMFEINSSNRDNIIIEILKHFEFM